ncbi:MAG: DUF4238 domain-containing protein [bacterium]|nr:DUF4238 domain-containing protein [bacterium]
MSGPTHQHFIPRSYLNNFAVVENGKHWVEGKLKNEEIPRSKLLSTKDICVNKNLYTIPHIEGDDKYKIERYYANEVDGVYPEVYQMLTSPDKMRLTKEERKKILMTTLSLFFRTPKFLNINSSRIKAIIKYAMTRHCDKKGNVKFTHQEFELDFHVDNVESILEHYKIKNKFNFLQNHLKEWHEFVNFKQEAGLTVYKINGDVELISSDNPVIIHSIELHKFDVFDPTNMIELPLDNQHYLVIFPNTVDSIDTHLFRQERDNWFAINVNRGVDKGSEDWILGKPGTITKYLKDKIKYEAFSSENVKYADEFIGQVQDMQKLTEIMEKYGFYSPQTANEVKMMRKKAIHDKDPNFRKLIIELAKGGYFTV